MIERWIRFQTFMMRISFGFGEFPLGARPQARLDVTISRSIAATWISFRSFKDS